MMHKHSEARQGAEDEIFALRKKIDKYGTVGNSDESVTPSTGDFAPSTKAWCRERHKEKKR